jgi:hypothetical protein
MLDNVFQRAETIGDDAARKARDHILLRAETPPGVRAQAIDGGVALTGKKLRHRFITDPALRNFAR